MRMVKLFLILIIVPVIITVVIEQPEMVIAVLIAAVVCLLYLKHRKTVRMNNGAIRSKIASTYNVPITNLSESFDITSVAYEHEYCYNCELADDRDESIPDAPKIKHVSFHHQRIDKKERAFYSEACRSIQDTMNACASVNMFNTERVWVYSAKVCDDDPYDETKLMFLRPGGPVFAYRLYPSSFKKQQLTRLSGYNVDFICMEIRYMERFIYYYNMNVSNGIVEMPWRELQPGDLNIETAVVVKDDMNRIAGFEIVTEDPIQMLYIAKEYRDTSRSRVRWVSKVTVNGSVYEQNGVTRKLVVSPDFEREVFIIEYEENRGNEN